MQHKHFREWHSSDVWMKRLDGYTEIYQYMGHHTEVGRDAPIGICRFCYIFAKNRAKRSKTVFFCAGKKPSEFCTNSLGFSTFCSVLRQKYARDGIQIPVPKPVVRQQVAALRPFVPTIYSYERRTVCFGKGLGVAQRRFDLIWRIFTQNSRF